MTDADYVLAARVAAGVLACPAVESLTAGPHGTCSTYGPSVRIEGVCILAEAVEVHVVSHWGVSAMEVGAQIRELLMPDLPGRVVDVVIEGIGDTRADAPAGIGAAS